MSATETATLVAEQLIRHTWQALLIAGALGAALHAARRGTAATRHALCAMALFALLVLPLAAWLPVPRWSAAPQTKGAAAAEPFVAPPEGISGASDATTARAAGTTRRGRSSSGFLYRSLPGFGSSFVLVSGVGAGLAAGIVALRGWMPFGAWIVCVAWATGAGWTVSRLGLHVARGERLRRKAAVWDAGTGAGDVRTSPLVTSPLVVGLVRPAIVLPAGFPRRCSRADLERVLAHERAHVERRDGWWHLLQRVAEALFFFHPGVRWVARRMEFEREAACDDRAAACTGGLAAYATSLLTVLEAVQRAPRPILAVGALSSKSQLARRVESMLDSARDHRPRSSVFQVAAFTAACATLVAALAFVSPTPTLAEGDSDRRDVADVANGADHRGATPLIRAARDGNAAEVGRLLDAGADPNESARQEPRSPLYAAALSGDVATLRVLLDRGAAVDRVVHGDATPLMAACGRGHFEAAYLLVSRGANVNVALSGDGTPLINAAAGGDARIVALLLDHGADVNAAVSGDGNPLIVASRAGHANIVHLLVAAGAEPDGAVSGDGSPLINAAQSGDERAVEALLAAGADPDLAVSGDGSPLIGAAAYDDTKMVERLLEAGANPNGAVSGDGSALIAAVRAARSGGIDTVQTLLDAGADVNMAVPGDGNPLIAAAAAGNTEIARYLIDRGANVDAVVPGDETPLINAAGGGHVEVAALLLDAGADPNLAVRADSWRNGRRRTLMRSPLGEARKSRDDAMIRLLEQRGATD